SWARVCTTSSHSTCTRAPTRRRPTRRKLCRLSWTRSFSRAWRRTPSGGRAQLGSWRGGCRPFRSPTAGETIRRQRGGRRLGSPSAGRGSHDARHRQEEPVMAGERVNGPPARPRALLPPRTGARRSLCRRLSGRSFARLLSRAGRRVERLPRDGGGDQRVLDARVVARVEQDELEPEVAHLDGRPYAGCFELDPAHTAHQTDRRLAVRKPALHREERGF